MSSKYICPILTSFNEDGTVNYEDMHGMYDRVIEAGVHGVLTGGSAGEFYALSYEEVKELMLDAVTYINGRAIVIAGTGRMNREETVRLSNEMIDAGADAVMIVGPYYNACGGEDVFQYFDYVLGHIKGKVYLYNYEDRTGYDVPLETVLRLLERHPNFVGMKDTHPVGRHTQKYIYGIAPKFPHFEVYTGYDTNCIPVVLSGGAGCIGALSNVYPRLCYELTQALDGRDYDAIERLQRCIDQYALFYEAYLPFIPLMKWALNDMGVSMKEYCREPITALTNGAKESLATVADQLWRK